MNYLVIVTSFAVFILNAFLSETIQAQISQRINLKVTNDNYQDKALLVTGPNFTDDKDYGYDAIKFFGTQGLSIFYFYKNEKYSISAFKDTTKMSLQVGVNVPSEQEIQFSLDTSPTLINDNLVYLRDTNTDSLYALSTTPISFTITPSDEYRFILVVQQYEKETHWENNAWTNGIPNDTTSIIFRDNYTLSANLSGKDITINNGVTIQIDSLKKLTVTGNIHNKGSGITGAGTLELSNELNTILFTDTTSISGVLSITDNTIVNTNNCVYLESGAILYHQNAENLSGDIILEREGNNHTLAYNYWSLPVKEKNQISNIGSLNKYVYDEPNTQWSPLNDTIIESGQGFICTGAGTISIAGTPYADSVLYPITAQGGFFDFGDGLMNHKGFNLIGNPFLAPLDYNSFINTNPQIVDGAIYLYRGNSDGTGSYSIINQFDNHPIPSFQGFFIKTQQDTSILFLHSHKTTNGNNSLYRINKIQLEQFTLTIKDGNFEDKITLGLSSSFSSEKDFGYDAVKLFGDQPLSIAFKKDGDYLGSLALPSNKENVEIPIIINASKNYEISLKSHSPNFELFLKDIDKNITYSLNSTPLKFINQEHKNLKLFIRQIGYLTEIKKYKHQNWAITPFCDRLVIQTNTPPNEVVHINIIDLTGKVLWEKTYLHQKGEEVLLMERNMLCRSKGMIIQIKGNHVNINKKYIITP